VEAEEHQAKSICADKVQMCIIVGSFLGHHPLPCSSCGTSEGADASVHQVQAVPETSVSSEE
jgi:hypothetical protein